MRQNSIYADGSILSSNIYIQKNSTNLQRVDLVLVPLKAGFLPFPQVLLECDDNDGLMENTELECRNLKCASQILIVPRIQSKSFRVFKHSTVMR
jgi:hypothetical protein